jgi:hypothetical protein
MPQFRLTCPRYEKNIIGVKKTYQRGSFLLRPHLNSDSSVLCKIAPSKSGKFYNFLHHLLVISDYECLASRKHYIFMFVGTFVKKVFLCYTYVGTHDICMYLCQKGTFSYTQWRPLTSAFRNRVSDICDGQK